MRSHDILREISPAAERVLDIARYAESPTVAALDHFRSDELFGALGAIDMVVSECLLPNDVHAQWQDAATLIRAAITDKVREELAVAKALREHGRDLHDITFGDVA